MYEHFRQPPLTHRQFVRRLAQHGGYAGLLVIGSVLIGTFGYRLLADQSWIDSFLNTCMLLGGMGPVGDLPTNSGKIFAALFALYAGLVFIATTVIMFTPVAHRILHKFHWDGQGQKEE